MFYVETVTLVEPLSRRGCLKEFCVEKKFKTDKVKFSRLVYQFLIFIVIVSDAAAVN